MRPGAKKSIVWNYFQKENTNKCAICKICKKEMKYFGNTTNLKQHLLRLHPTLMTVNDNTLNESIENSEKSSPIPNVEPVAGPLNNVKLIPVPSANILGPSNNNINKIRVAKFD